MFRDIGRGKLSEQVVDAVMNRILNGDLKPADALPSENELAQQFGVSRTVIREAMKVLEAWGLVEIGRGRGRGAVVASNSLRVYSNIMSMASRQQKTTLRELMEVRQVLEVAIAGMAAERATDADRAAMRRALDLMHSTPDKAEGYVDADLAFHRALADAAHNTLLNFILDSVAELSRLSRQVSFRGPQRVEVAIAAHEAIYRAVAAGDPDAARAAMRRHLDQTCVDLREALGDDALLQPLRRDGS